MKAIDFLTSKRADGGIGVKICGVTVEAEARGILELGADALGFNFWPPSKRFFGRVEDHPWLRDLPECRVGVFVDAAIAEILALWEGGWIDAAQLHGSETREDCERLVKAGVPVMKAVGVKDASSLEAIGSMGTKAVLLDAFAPEEKGGSGRVIDWELARATVVDHPELRIVLSGGLTAENVGEAVRVVAPAAVDAASGVESSPGRKDLEKVRRFIEAARGG